MIILGIDPGSRKAGYGVIEVKGNKLSYVSSGTMHYDQAGDFLNRLGLIYESCRELIEKYAPDEISLESLIYVKSVTSLSKLAQARGAMIAAFSHTHKGKIFEYSPNLVKSSVSGHGHASKEGVDKSMRIIFGKDLDFQTHDESDGLAIALAHSLLKGQVGASKGSRSGSLKSAFRHLEKK